MIKHFAVSEADRGVAITFIISTAKVFVKQIAPTQGAN
nr:MAG TPA: hypothetical protein [Caudoviricetes sp.]